MLLSSGYRKVTSHIGFHDVFQGRKVVGVGGEEVRMTFLLLSFSQIPPA